MKFDISKMDLVPYIDKTMSCICGRDEKYINCCNKKKLNIIQLLDCCFNKIRDKKQKFCVYNDIDSSCKNPPIASHSISKTINLIPISEKNNLNQDELYCFYAHSLAVIVENNKKIKFLKTSANVASTFNGLCSHHDSEYHQNIDALFDVKNKEHYLYSFKRESLRQHYFNKKNINSIERLLLHLYFIYKGIKNQRYMHSKEISLYIENIIKHYETINLFLKDTNKILSETIKKIDFNNINISCMYIQFDELIPFNFSTSTTDKNGNIIHYALLSNKKSSIFVICTPNTNTFRSDLFEIFNVKENSDVLLGKILERSLMTDNSFYSISMIDSLEKKELNKISRIYNEQFFNSLNPENADLKDIKEIKIEKINSNISYTINFIE